MSKLVAEFRKDMAENPEAFLLFDPKREVVLDENGKDKTHPMYGKKRPDIVAMNKKRTGENNPRWLGDDRKAYVKKGHGARLGLKRGPYKARVNKYETS